MSALVPNIFRGLRKLLSVLIALLFCSTASQAQTTLVAGDIGFSSFATSAAAAQDTFTFVLLANITSNTTIYFTDRGYSSTGGTFSTVGSTEGTIKWVSGSALAIGTEIMITNLTAYAGGLVNGTVTKEEGSAGVGLSISNTGDQIFAFQSGTTPSNSNIIAGIHFNRCAAGTTDAAWDNTACSVGPGSSQLPSSLTAGFSSVWVGNGTNVMVEGVVSCTGTPYSSVSALRTFLFDNNNWTKNSTNTAGLATPAGCTFYGIAPPVVTTNPQNASICAAGSTSFSIAATNSPTSYAWQVNTGGGFGNISNGGVYSGATTTTLTLSNVPAGYNAYTYRCIAFNGGGSDTSTAATLTVASGVPSISVQPGNASTCPGGNAAFSVTATNGTLSYQWQVNTGGGFGNITNGGVYSNATTAALNLTGAPSAYTGYLYRAQVTNACGTTSSNSATLRFSNSWTGASSALWSNAANWSCNAVPDANTDVTIPSGVPNTPIVNTTANVRDLTIQSGASLFVGSANSLNIYGNATNQGTLTGTAAAATVNYAAAAAQNISSGSYGNLTISSGGTKTLTGTASVSGTLNLSNGKLQLGNNTLSVDGSISGADASNYVITNGTGGLQITNIGTGGKTGNILFPVGSDATDYTPVTLNNTGTADAFTARVGDNVYASYINDVPQGAAITSGVVGKTWYVAEQNAGGSNAALTVQWNATDELSGFNRLAASLSHFTGSSWDPMTLTSASGSNPYTITRSGLTSFSPFGVGNASTALPLTWKSFNGSYENGKVLLKWTVANETGIDAYGVERSEDGVHFQAVGQVKATTATDYRFADVPNTGASAYFYRIRIVESSGRSNYSAVLRIQTAGAVRENVRLFSNPIGNDIQLEVNAAGSSSLRLSITDAAGRKVGEVEVPVQKGLQVLSVPALHLPQGQVLLLRAVMGGQTWNFKALK